jgi:hypothetical protein
MSAEIIKPEVLTYWILTNNGSYSDGVTGPGQVTTVGNGWTLCYIGSDYNEYAAKCSEFMITPRVNSENEPVLPQPRISARQIRLWLIRNGISLQNVIDAINNIEDSITRDSTMVEWEYAPYVERNHPMLLPLAAALGLSESDIERAFNEAISI